MIEYRTGTQRIQGVPVLLKVMRDTGGVKW